MATIKGTSGDDRLNGTDGGDSIDGGAGKDTIEAGGGDDTVDGGAGDDAMTGGAGVDTLSFASASNGVTVNLLSGSSTGHGADTFSGFEAVVGSNFDDLLISSRTGATLNGGGGTDIFVLFDGADVVDGGDDRRLDFANYEFVGPVTVNLSITGPQNTGGGGIDTLIRVEGVTGSGFDDVLTGNSVGNVFLGGLGNDRLDGVGGHDGAAYSDGARVRGITVDLQLSGGPQTIDAVSGEQETLVSIERLYGSRFDDRLFGDAGDNGFGGGPGDDLMDGRGGFDWVSYFEATSGVTASLATRDWQNTVGAGTDKLVDIEMLIGSRWNDNLAGGAGDDLLAGTGGNDRLDGGFGRDTAVYGADHNIARGVVVDLSITGPQDTLGEGVDTLVNIEDLAGSDLDDQLTGDAGANRLAGAYGADTLRGGGGDDILTGEVDETRIADQESFGAPGNDQLYGEGGNDVLHGGLGDDLFDGGAGVDTASFERSLARVNVDLRTSGPQSTGEGSDTFVSVEKVIGSGFDDVIVGRDGDSGSLAQDDRLLGRAGSDILRGGGGSDQLDGEAGNDIIDGGDGFDYFTLAIIFSESTGPLTADLAITGPQNTGHGMDTLISIEGLTGAGGNDVLRGNGEANVLTGQGGADVLEGRGGADTLFAGSFIDGRDASNNTLRGGAGDDTLFGGQGADILDGGLDRDTASYALALSAVSVNLALTSPQATGSGADTLIGIEDLVGSRFDDALSGNAQANALSGGEGNDGLFGGGGDDRLDGGAGADTARYTGARSDYAVLTLEDGRVQVTDLRKKPIDGVDLLTSVETLSFSDGSLATAVAAEQPVTIPGGKKDGSAIYGGSGRDQLAGGHYADQLFGRGGDDILAGGRGDDRLTGGAGADLFVFGKKGGDDTITDFQLGVDHLRLEKHVRVTGLSQKDVDGNGVLDAVIAFNDGSVTLLNVGALTGFDGLLA